MRLKKIKLAGFKSFVDPTVVTLPSNLVGVVGPNGCGKSNIIDAVVWVMGERSAKYLRGENATDVIFSGSSARQPVSRASVELLFDNADGTLGGEYAGYAEISIKRQVDREGDSTYLLNNVRCRRKDVIDVFQGTGLGSRSYSIIGQNMISQVIEAKPDELRSYLEEAAGISKYKERRRDTEARIRHTRENIARLEDVILELDKQLNTLKRQASAAERFKAFKQEEKMVQAQYVAIQHQAFHFELKKQEADIATDKNKFEETQAQLRHIELDVEKSRDIHTEKIDIFNEVQKRYYSVGSEIARIEQSLQHYRERQKQWQTDLVQSKNDWESAVQHLQEVHQQIHLLTEEMIQLEPEEKIKKEKAEQSVTAHAGVESRYQAWQGTWDHFNEEASNTSRMAQVEQTRLQHLEQKIQELEKRHGILITDSKKIDFTELNNTFNQYPIDIQHIKMELDKQSHAVFSLRDALNHQRQENESRSAALDILNQTLQHKKAKQVSLETMQEAALSGHHESTKTWLTEHHLLDAPRVGAELDVESGWERAVETVLGDYLQAICVADIDSVASVLDELTAGKLCLFDQNILPVMNTHFVATPLSHKIKSTLNIQTLTAGVYAAENIAEALALRSQLSAQESVITPEGVWLSQSWVRVSYKENVSDSIFVRKKEIETLVADINVVDAEKMQMAAQLQTGRERSIALETQLEVARQNQNELNAQLASMSAEARVIEGRIHALKERERQFISEMKENRDQHVEANQQLIVARVAWEKAMQAMTQHAEHREGLLQDREAIRHALLQHKNNMHQDRDQWHAVAIRLNAKRTELDSIKQTVSRLESQAQHLNERNIALETQIQEANEPIVQYQQGLELALAKHVAVETELNAVRSAVEAMDHRMRELDEKHRDLQVKIDQIRERLEEKRLASQTIKVKIQTLEEEIAKTIQSVENILSELPEEANVVDWRIKLEEIQARITKLGPVNLVAIEEYDVCLERKSYLDKQNQDLLEALTTLEDAISKIDRETKVRFKETYEKVNQCFQTLFPKIFGGGHASLELTGDNLLETGISMLASPPGKRNTTIHLLSGGEKALTAIALVFSIFQLNPAPFCMLDEVDAPLDDANVGNFCRLVKEMSEKVQFIFISHNKITIEMADQLMGVTMHEPGVSRLVSVDIEEAMAMADAV